MPEAPRILSFLMSHWNSQEEAEGRACGMFGLRATHERIQRYLGHCETFIACGTWSNPEWNPMPPLRVVNAGAPFTKPYEVHWWNYSLCAFTAAFAYALDKPHWNLLALLDNDALIGAVDFNTIIHQFMERPDIMLTANWHDGTRSWPAGPLIIWKREGVARWQHGRLRPNLSEAAEQPMFPEEELARLFDGRIFNPWPFAQSVRQDHNAELNRQAMTWPFVRCPCNSIINRYLREQTRKAKPLKP